MTNTDFDSQRALLHHSAQDGHLEEGSGRRRVKSRKAKSLKRSFMQGNGEMMGLLRSSIKRLFQPGSGRSSNLSVLRSRRMQVESLEQLVLLAGDIMVNVAEDGAVVIPLGADLQTTTLPSHGTALLQPPFEDGNVLYTPTADFAGMDSFQYSTETEGPFNVEITVTRTNDAPQVSATTPVFNISEGGTTTVDGITVSDPVDAPNSPETATAIYTVTLSLSQTAAVEFQGSAPEYDGAFEPGVIAVTPTLGVTSSTNEAGAIELAGTLDDLNIALASLEFDAVSEDFFGTATITVTVDDGGTGGEAGAAALTGSRDIIIEVANVQDPLVQVALVAEPKAVNEGQSVLINGQNENPADLIYVDSDNIAQYVVTATEHGSVHVSGSAVTSFTQADLDAGLVTFMQNGDEDATASFTFSVSDGSGPAQTGTIHFNVTNLNDPPVVTVNGPLVVDEGGTVPLTVAELTATDTDGDDAAMVYTITGLTHGTILKDGVALTGSTFTQAELAGGQLSYQHDGSETTSDTLTVTVADDDSDSTGPVSLAITINALNDGPVIATNAGLFLAEGATATIGMSRLKTTDAEGDTLTYTLGSVPAVGTLRLAGAPLSVGSTFTQAQIDAGSLAYEHDGSENFAASFDFTVSDGVASTGSATFAITISNVNDEQQLSVSDLTVGEGASALITSANLLATDVDAGDTPDQLVYTVTVAPTSGGLYSFQSVDEEGEIIWSGPHGVGFTFTQADVNAGDKLQYRHSGEVLSDAIGVSVDDGQGTASAGTLNIVVTAVDDAPTLDANNGVTVDEGATVDLTTAALSASDVDSAAADIVYTVVALPAHGTIQVNGVALGLNGTFTQADLAAGNVVKYVHNGTESTSDSFDFTLANAADPLGTPETFEITVNPVNDEQMLVVNSGLLVSEGNSELIGSASLLTTDSDLPAQTITYTLDSAPTYGDVRLNGVALIAGQTFTQSDINAGRVRFAADATPEPPAGVNNDGFDFSVDDGIGSVTSAHFNITIVPTNDDPVVNNTHGTPATGLPVDEDEMDVVVDGLSSTDEESPAGDLTYTITALPTEGTLTLNGVAAVVGDTFTETELQDLEGDPLLTYSHGGGGATTDSFRFIVSDVDGGEADEATYYFAINQTINDPESVITHDSELTVVEGGNILIDASIVETVDEESDAEHITYTVAVAPSHGELQIQELVEEVVGEETVSVWVWSGAQGVGSTFTQADINSGNVRYVSDGVDPEGDGETDTFTLEVNDAAIAEGDEGAPQSLSFNVTITPINDIPVNQTPALAATVAEAGTLDITTSLLQFTDEESGAANVVYTVDSVPAYGQLENDGAVLGVGGTFTQADIDGGKLKYIHGGDDPVTDMAGPDGFTFSVSDNGIAPDNIPAVLTGYTFAIQVTAVNDTPTVATTNAVVDEAGEVVISSGNLAGADEENGAADLTYTLDSVPAHGELQLWGLWPVDEETEELGWRPLAIDDTFTQAQVDAGDVKYVNAGAEQTTDSFNFTLTDAGTPAESTTGTLTIDITTSNDDPAVEVSGELTVAEGGQVTVDVLSASDEETSSAFDEDWADHLVYTVDTVPAAGQLELTTDPGVAITSFTQADLDAGHVVYVHDDTEPVSGAELDGFSVFVTDGGSATSETVSVIVNITPVNDNAPIGTDGSLTVLEGGVLEAVDAADGLLSFVSDLDLPNDTLTISVTTEPEHASSFTWNADGTFSYMHDGTETTSDSLVFVVTDAAGHESDPITVTLNVTPTNDAPTVVAPATASGTEGGSVAISGISIDDIDAGTADLTVTLSVDSGEVPGGMIQVSETAVDGVPSGSITGNGTGSVTLTGTIAELNATLAAGVTFTGDVNFFTPTPVNLTVTANDGGATGDGGAKSTSANIALSIAGVNDPPIADAENGDNDLERTALQDGVLTAAVVAAASPGAGNEAAEGQFVVLLGLGTSPPSHGTAVANLSNGTIQYTPAPGFVGTDTISYVIADNLNVQTQATLTVTVVAPIGAAPTFLLDPTAPSPIVVAEDSTAAQNVTHLIDSYALGAGNSAPQFLVSVVPGSVTGTLMFDASKFAINPATGNFRFEPVANTTGSAQLEIVLRVSDGLGGFVDSDPQVIGVEVLEGNNDAPVAAQDNYSVAEGGVLTVAAPGVLGNDSDPDTASGSWTVALLDGPLYSTDFTFNTDGSFVYEHDATTETATDSFTYELSDGTSTVVGTVIISIVDDNDNETSISEISGPATVGEGATVTYSVEVTDADGGAELTYVWTAVNTATLQQVFQASGVDLSSVSFAFPDQGSYEVKVVVSDRGDAAVEDTLAVSVTDVAPTVALTGAASVDEGSTYTLNIGAVTDPGADTVQSYHILWGDGTPPQIVPAGGAITHVFADDEGHSGTISVGILNEEGFFNNAGSLAVTVNNVAPTAFIGNGGAVNEGSSGLVFFIGQNDPSPVDTLVYDWDFDNDGVFEVVGSTLSAATVPGSYLTDSVGNATIRGRVRDDDGGSLELTTTIEVNNVDPVVNAGADVEAFVGIPLTKTISIVDPGDALLDATITFDNGDAPITLTDVGHNFQLTHTFGSVGTVQVTVTVTDDEGATASDTFEVSVVAATLQITDFAHTPSGFSVQFNQAIDLSGLNLYVDTPDVMVTDDSGNSVAGSLTWDSSSNTLSFIKTGGPFATGSYDVTLVSGPNAFTTSTGDLLDGNGDLTSGDDFTTSFSVAAAGRVVSIADFARGPGQVVDLTPANSSDANLPIRIDSANGVTAIDLDLEFDPSVLSVSNIRLGALASSLGWVIVPNMTNAASGMISVAAFGIAPLSGANVALFDIEAMVPATAAYGSSHAIEISNVRVNEDAIPAIADSGFHKAVYVGDADASGAYTGTDATLIAGVEVGLTTGFVQFDDTDPNIIGDATGNGEITSADAQLVFAEAASIGDTIPQLPPIPSLALSSSGALDPLLALAQAAPAAPGCCVDIPVTIDVGDVNNVGGATFDIFFDDSVLSFVEVELGNFWQSSDGWSVATDVVGGQLRVSLANLQGGSSGLGAGDIVTVRFDVLSGAELGESSLDIVKVDANEGGLVWTDEDGSVIVQPQMPGDANLDGQVDATDLGIWQANIFQVGTDCRTGDFNGDGVTDVRDFNVWNANKFTSELMSQASLSTRTPRAASGVSTERAIAVDQVIGARTIAAPRVLRSSLASQDVMSADNAAESLASGAELSVVRAKFVRQASIARRQSSIDASQVDAAFGQQSLDTSDALFASDDWSRDGGVRGSLRN